MGLGKIGFLKVMAAWGLLACSPLNAETLFESDFTKQPERSVLQLKDAAVANGFLTLGKEGKCSAAATFNVKSDKPLILSYSLRFASVSQAHREGVCLYGAEDRRNDFLTRSGMAKDITAYITQKGRLLVKQNFQQGFEFPVGENAPFVSCELRLEKSFVEMKVEGRSLGTIPVEFLPVEKIVFYANDAKLQIDDVKVSTIEEGDRIVRSEKPVFEADFNNGLAALDENGAKIEPVSEKMPALKPGMDGSALGALRADKFKTLTYNVGKILGREGAIMFWTSPERCMDTLALLDENGKTRLTCRAMNYGFAINLVRPDGTKYEFFSRGSKYFMLPDTWNHYAVTWNDKGEIRIFRNGLPYSQNYDFGELNVGHSSGLDFSDIRKIQILESCGALIDDLKLYRRHVSPSEVYAEFRKSSPLDVVLDDAIVQSKEDAALDLEFAPGGTYTRASQEGPLSGNVKADLTLELKTLPDGKVLKTLSLPLEVKDSPVHVKFPTGKLAEGEYLVLWSMKLPDGKLMKRALLFECHELPTKELVASKEDIKLGKLVFEKKFSDPADSTLLKEGPLFARKDGGLELGSDKGNRLGIVIPGLKEFQQKPLAVEIEWPDDAARMMGFYIYVERPKGESYRDRLQGGIQAGREYPNTGKHIVTRYIYWPQSPTILFEARTMAKNFPGAINAIRFYEIEGGILPKLAIDKPQGMDFRKVSVFDEDQTLNVILAAKTTPDFAQRLCDYMDYTGQTTYQTAILRYYYSYFPFPDARANVLLPPGHFPYLIDALGSRGKDFVGLFDIGTIPEVYYAKALERHAPDLFALDKDLNEYGGYDGRVGLPNISNPLVRKMAARYLLDFKNEMAKPNFTGISVWSTMGWRDLSVGYDNYTVEKFSADTGVEVPKTGRYEFLNSAPVLPKWTAWRARQVFEMVKELRTVMDSVKPSLKLYVMRRADFDWNLELEKLLPQLPNTSFCDVRRPTSYRHTFHWGSPETQLDEALYDFQTNQEFFKRKNNEMVSLFYGYYETFAKSLSKEYGCYFQNADVKPWGRYFLKELAFNVAAGDVREIVMGGQPFASWGREEETREFAKAFSALPARSFTRVDNPNSSIATRYLNTEKGTYFYLVSLVQSDSKAKLDFGGRTPDYVDLSTGLKSSDVTISLKPFELRSFLIPAENVKIKGVEYSFPKELKDFYAQRIAQLDTAQKTLESRGVDTAAEKMFISKLKAAFSREDYAETHWLAFSRIMNQLLGKLSNIEKVVQQAGMVKENRIALNCGASDFYSAADGRLFFPDQKFEGNAAFGYFGGNRSVVREITGLKDSVTPDLFKTEAYDIDGYKFRLANGSYTVRLYMKTAWRDNFKEGNVFTVYAQGKPLYVNLDLFKECKGDYLQPVVLETKGLEVSDGELVLKFETPKGIPSDRRLCNGIEIFPDK